MYRRELACLPIRVNEKAPGVAFRDGHFSAPQVLVVAAAVVRRATLKA